MYMYCKKSVLMKLRAIIDNLCAEMPTTKFMQKTHLYNMLSTIKSVYAQCKQ